MPACAACASVYQTECVYDLNSDHRRKGVYKKDIDQLKTQNGTLQTLVEAILNVRPAVQLCLSSRCPKPIAFELTMFSWLT